MNREYAEKVEILLRVLPIVMDEKVFAVHGGSAINLFVRDLPRYSVDIDLTYMPLQEREESLNDINTLTQKPYTLSASIGSVIKVVDENDTLNDLLEKADEKIGEYKTAHFLNDLFRDK